MIDQFIFKCFRKGAEKEKAGQYDTAFSFYQAGNAMKFKRLVWEEAVENELHAAITETFTPDYIARHQININARVAPVFIVGMPRSGSTLIEQILDTHPSIHGAGEVAYLVEGILAEFKEPYIYPEDLEKLGRIGLWKIRKYYLSLLERDGQGAMIVCDKMLTNFHHIGLIAILFPNAKIIHAVRNRQDCLHSCYAKQFKGDNLPFTYDQDALKNYHRRYIALMQHWKTVLPGMVHEIEYESMVRNHDKTVRDLLDYVGVPFDGACLNFHQNTREVKTASRDQVNKPLYASSIGRGIPFYEHYNKA